MLLFTYKNDDSRSNKHSSLFLLNHLEKKTFFGTNFHFFSYDSLLNRIFLPINITRTEVTNTLAYFRYDCLITLSKNYHCANFHFFPRVILYLLEEIIYSETS